MRRRYAPDQRAQLHVVEAIIVGVLVFSILFVTAVFRLPTSPATFQEAELSGLAHDTLVALLAKPPARDADCNEFQSPPAHPCPFESELERMISLALGYQGATYSTSPTMDPNTDELVAYLEQALPPGTRYILSFSNGVSSTTIYPPNLVPPALDVSASHVLMTFRWDQFAPRVDNSMLIRINEITGFKTSELQADGIRDPLNRIKNHLGVNHLTSFADAAGGKTVPEDAIYGTYEVRRSSGTAVYFTIAPPGIFGAGSSILTGDRDNATSVLPRDQFHFRVRHNDTTGNGFTDDDAMYLDFTTPNASSPNRVEIGDLRLTAVPNCRGVGVSCAAGTYVESGDADLSGSNQLFAFPLLYDKVRAPVTGATPALQATLEAGEALYFDREGPGGGSVTAGDRRLSRYGTFPFGSVVGGSDPDIGTPLAAGATDFTKRNVLFGDLDGDGVHDPGEPVYLDFVGHGQAEGLEAYDLHLSAKGNPTARFIYDIRMVVWYGI